MADTKSQLGEWASGWQKDVDTLKKVVASEKADRDARRHAATALNYLVSRMDLIPDWEETIGVLDDILVLRVCAGSASKSSDEGLDDKVLTDLGRLANQEERIDEILGKELHVKLRTFCEKFADQSVRGRTAHAVVSDAKARELLFAEVDDAVKRAPAVKITDPDAVAKKLKSYLSAKLT